MSYQTPFQHATATVRVQDDGKASIDGCVIHWIVKAPLSQGPQEKAISREFGLGRGEHRSTTFYGPVPSRTELLLVTWDTWAVRAVRQPQIARQRPPTNGDVRSDLTQGVRAARAIT